MVRHVAGRGVNVPAGFATTWAAYLRFVDANDLRAPIAALLNDLEAGRASLSEAGAAIRRAFLREVMARRYRRGHYQGLTRS